MSPSSSTGTRPGFHVIVGVAPTLYPSLACGATGGVVAVANAIPELCVRLHALVRAGRHDEALALQRAIAPLGRAVTTTWGVPGLKFAMELAGYVGGAPRRPLLAGRRGRPPRDSHAVRSGDGCGVTPSHDLHDSPTIERILLGPGPSPVSPRVMRAMVAPVLSHLDPDMLALMDDVRARLGRTFRAGEGSLSLAVSGTGSAGMETAVANMVREGTHVLVVVTGYFGERLADLCTRYGALVSRLEVPWGRAVDPESVRRRLQRSRRRHRRDGARRDVDRRAQPGGGGRGGRARARLPDARRRRDLARRASARRSTPGRSTRCYSCTQKGLGAPSGLSPISFSARGRERARRRSRRSFYFDLSLLEQYWVHRKYHHTIAAPLVYALREALVAIDEEGLEARWMRHRRHHLVLAAGLGAMGLELLPPEGERLWSLNAVCVPDGIDEAAVRRDLLRALQPRDRRRPRAARRPHLARRPDGQRLEQPADSALHQRARARAARAGLADHAGHRHGGRGRRAVSF